MDTGHSAIITINQQRYHIDRTSVALSIQAARHLRRDDAEYIPVTAIEWSQPTFVDEDLRKCCAKYAATDDVWSTDFLHAIILLLPSNLKVAVRSKKVFQVNNTKTHLPCGPLFVEKATRNIFKLAKLVLDTHHAFISAITPETQSGTAFCEFPEQPQLEIAIPSRLYFKATEDQPLAGLRVAVKDTIALKGLRTGYGSKAWADTYGPQQITAPCVRTLLDAGAVVVGKVKSSEFAEGVDPAVWEEGICPFNPRGDGQQKPSSSSTGSASAVAAYQWLDVAYGTDTGGSIRHPAGVQGLFGQRPTHGSIDTTGVLGATPLFNTVGIFAREAKIFSKVGSYLVDPTFKQKIQPERRKYNLLYPTRAPRVDSRDPFHSNQLRWFPHPEVATASYTEAEKLIDSIVTQIEAKLNCTRVPFNLDELWRATHPIGQPRSVDEATGSIYGIITTASVCEADINQFMLDYAAANNGREPPISSIVRRRFEYGRQCSDEKITAAVEAMQAFSRWVLNDLFGSLNQDATTLLIFPQSWGRPDYRDEVPDQSGLFKEFFSIHSFAYLCGCPDYTIPIGEIPFESQHSKTTEYLPVSLSLLARPGMDQELFGVVDYLHEEGVIPDVKAGSRMYESTPQAVDTDP